MSSSFPSLTTNPFRSFWMAGYECSDQQNCFGQRVDLLNLTGHLALLDQDYEDLQSFGLGTVREGIRWSQIERTPYHYNWQPVAEMLAAGRRHNIQQVWDLCHFGYPDDLTPLHPLFAHRFAALCRAFVAFYRQHCPHETLIVTPINEVSFMSWLGGDVRGTQPYCVGQGWEVKRGLMRAYIEGVAALREADPGVRILTTEPLIRIVPPLNPTRAQREQARQLTEHQFQAVDMLAGYLCPELGGRPEYLDILGFNYYYNNQWEVHTQHRLGWVNEPYDPRWQPLSAILRTAYERYQRPIILSETSHPGLDRPHWMRMIGHECATLLQQGIPLWGACLYPILDRPDWDFLDHEWHRSGLWDAVLRPGQPPLRVLHEPYAAALREAQAHVAPLLAPAHALPAI